MRPFAAVLLTVLICMTLCGCPPGRPTTSGRGGESPSGDIDRLRVERDTLMIENALLRAALLGTPTWQNTVQTTREGGFGGLPYLRMCPDEYGLIGFRGRAGSLIDTIFPICGSIPNATNLPHGFSSEIPLHPVGGSGGAGFERMCPNGTHVTGARGRVSSDFVRGVSLFCGVVSEAPDTSEAEGSALRRSGGLQPIGDASQGRSFRHSCPDGYAVVGISGHAGAYVDSLAFVCGQVNQDVESPEGAD